MVSASVLPVWDSVRAEAGVFDSLMDVGRGDEVAVLDCCHAALEHCSSRMPLMLRVRVFMCARPLERWTMVLDSTPSCKRVLAHAPREPEARAPVVKDSNANNRADRWTPDQKLYFTTSDS